MRSFIIAATLAAAIASPAFATQRGGSSSGELSGFVGFGSFQTQGGAVAGSAFGGQAEAFGNGSAGTSFTRCSTCGGANFSGWQNNEAGALTQGNAAALGASNGAAQGGAFGGFLGASRFNRR